LYQIYLDNSIVFNLDTSDESSLDETSGSSFIEENSLDWNCNDEDEVIDNEQPVFDSSKEIDYKVKYKQAFEEIISPNYVYILNLDAHKM